MSKRATIITLGVMTYAALVVIALGWHYAGQTSVAPVPHSAPTTANGCTDPHTALFNPCAHLDTTQTRDVRPAAYECDEVVAHIYATQAYHGTPDEQACVGEEDDPRVGLALDYGMTADQYAAAERAQR